MKTELAKEINRTDYYDFINKKKYKINKITTKDGQDLWVKYLFAFYKLLEHIYGHDVIGVITLEEIAHIKWVNDNTIVEPTTNINIKKLIFCAKSVFQKFILQYQRKLPSFEHETNNFMANIPSESSVHIIDIINNIPYMSLVCSIQLLNGTKALNLPRYGSFIQFNNIYNIDEIPKAIFYLFYKPNITQTAIQDIMQYYLTFMDTCMNVNIFKCLNNQKKAFQKPFDSYDCFGMQKSIDPKCTYNGLLNYIDYVSNKDSKSVDILNEIQNFINNAKFKYLPICFFFCIDKNILFALLNLNNRISDNSLCIAAYSKDGKILLQGDCNNNQTNTNTEPKDINIQIPEYQKIIFIVNENNDKTNINSQLSINEIKFIIENQENYKKLCDCKQYIPVLVSSYL